MPFHDPPRFPQGFRCASRNCGLKPVDKDLALFVSDRDAAAAALFTRNQFPGAPIDSGARDDQRRPSPRDRRQQQGEQRRHRRGGTRRTLDAWLRPQPLSAARRRDRILVSSTGVIGVPLPIEKIESGLRGMTRRLDRRSAGRRARHHDDGQPSEGALRVRWASDDHVDRQGLGDDRAEHGDDARLHLHRRRLRRRDARPRCCAAPSHVSFNMLSVDTDTSTSDTCALLANGAAGRGCRRGVRGRRSPTAASG